MNKPLTMAIKETKMKLASVCNESGLPPVILDLIMHGVYSEIHSLAERQSFNEEKSYKEELEKENKQIENKKTVEKE